MGKSKKKKQKKKKQAQKQKKKDQRGNKKKKILEKEEIEPSLKVCHHVFSNVNVPLKMGVFEGIDKCKICDSENTEINEEEKKGVNEVKKELFFSTFDGFIGCLDHVVENYENFLEEKKLMKKKQINNLKKSQKEFQRCIIVSLSSGLSFCLKCNSPIGFTKLIEENKDSQKIMKKIKELRTFEEDEDPQFEKGRETSDRKFVSLMHNFISNDLIEKESQFSLKNELDTYSEPQGNNKKGKRGKKGKRKKGKGKRFIFVDSRSRGRNKRKRVFNEVQENLIPAKFSEETKWIGQTFGLRNLGNSCFFNSLMQCIIHCKDFAEYFVNWKIVLSIQQIKVLRASKLSKNDKIRIEIKTFVSNLFVDIVNKEKEKEAKEMIRSNELWDKIITNVEEKIKKINQSKQEEIQDEKKTTKEEEKEEEKIEIEQSCGFCGYKESDNKEIGGVKVVLKRCRRCKSMYYCYHPYQTQGCQKKDWKNHKLVCTKEGIKKEIVTPSNAKENFKKENTSKKKVEKKFIKKKKEKKKPKIGVLTKALSKIFDRKYAYNTNSAYSPGKLLFEIVHRTHNLTRGHQEDSQELLNYLRFYLREEIVEMDKRLKKKKKENDNIVDRTLGIQLKSCVICEECKNSSITNAFEYELSVPIHHKNKDFETIFKEEEGKIKELGIDQSGEFLDPKLQLKYLHEHNGNDSITLIGCLMDFFKQGILDGNNKYHCEKCSKDKTDLKLARKQLSIKKLPKVLTIHLKRFKKDGRRCSKNSSRVKFPTTFDLKCFVSPPSLKNSQVDGTKYRLFGIVDHGGSLNGGHYIAYVNGLKFNSKLQTKREGWFRISDSSVSKTNESDVLRNASPYLLFYERIKK